MKGNLVKAGIAIAAAIIIVAVVAALVTGYMSAFKPKNNTTSTTGGYSGGGGIRGGGGGMSAAAITPTPSAGAMTGPGQMPLSEMQPRPMESPQMPAQAMPAAPMQAQVPSQQQATEPNPYMFNPAPSQQAVNVGPEAGGSPGSSGASPFFGNRGGSWFNIAPPVSATPVPTPPPATTWPVVAPAKGPVGQESPTAGLTPYEYGWRQVILRLLEVVPLIFPGYYPGLQWYIVPPAY